MTGSSPREARFTTRTWPIEVQGWVNQQCSVRKDRSIGGVVTDEQASVLPGVSLTLCESRAFSKLDASDRTHAAIIGLKRGIIEL